MWRDDVRVTLGQIARAQPANEAEVETKILLHVFRLLGYRDDDRADKPTVSMNFGREKKYKQPDFILYHGIARTLDRALVAIEAKALGESLDGAELQVVSYAAWAGTPFYMICNGEEILVSRFVPSGEPQQALRISVRNLETKWYELEEMVSRTSAILAKERLAYLTHYLPGVEKLPASEFFKEYLTRLGERFGQADVPQTLLTAPGSGNMVLPPIPVTAVIEKDKYEVPEVDLANLLTHPGVRFYLVGEPGSGKSTLCARITKRLVDEALRPGTNLIPVLISLRKGLPSSPFDALTEACTEMGVRVFPLLYRKSLDSVHTVLILDGLDEAPTPAGHSLSRVLDSLIQGRQNCSVLVTSRPSDDQPKGFLRDRGFIRARIRELTDTEVKSLLGIYIKDPGRITQLIEGDTLARLNLRSPLMALMGIHIATQESNWTALGKYDLYQRYVFVLYRYFGASSVRGALDSPELDSVMTVAARGACPLAA